MKLTCAFIASMLLAVSSYAGSTESPASNELSWNHHRGLFVEGTVGVNAFYALLPVLGNKGSINGWGAGAALGYNFLDNVALEGGFIYSSDLNAQVDEKVAGVNISASAAAELYIPYLAFRFSVPVGKKLSILFKLGGMYPYGNAGLKAQAAGIKERGRISGDHLMPFSGVGASYAVTPKLDITMLYQGAVYVMASGAVWSAGLTYHFS